MKKLIHWFDTTFNLPLLLMLFWALFWLLNGGDKFFNGQSAVSSLTKGVLRTGDDGTGEIQYTLHHYEPQGVYGVTRDRKMVNYFKRIYLPRQVALISLYGMAVFELLLGLAFLVIFIRDLNPANRGRVGPGLFGDRTIHRMAFKGSILVFLCFSVGDILFGDRAELWEHGTFMILTVITYDLWYRTDRFLISRREQGNDDGHSVQAASYRELT